MGDQPSTLLRFHDYLVRRKYRTLYSPDCRGTPGPKGSSKELIDAIIELKRRNARFGYPGIARIVSKTFGIQIDRKSGSARTSQALPSGMWGVGEFQNYYIRYVFTHRLTEIRRPRRRESPRLRARRLMISSGNRIAVAWSNFQLLHER